MQYNAIKYNGGNILLFAAVYKCLHWYTNDNLAFNDMMGKVRACKYFGIYVMHVDHV